MVLAGVDFPISDPAYFDFPTLFVAGGFIISAIGTLVARIVDTIKKPIWLNPDKEIEYWKKLGDLKNEYLQKKVEVTWGFYSMNVNAAVAIGLALLVHCLYSKSDHFPLLVLAIVVLFSLFVYLAWLTYQKVNIAGEEIRKMKLPSADESIHHI